MFEDAEKKSNENQPTTGGINPPRAPEDIFAGIKETAAIPSLTKKSIPGSGEDGKKSNIIINILVAILVVLILAVAGLILASKFLGFSGLSGMKDKFFPSQGQEVIINNENNETEKKTEIGGGTEIKEETPVENQENTVVEDKTPSDSASSSPIVGPLDGDNDSLSDLDENLSGTDPQKADTDGDGLLDGEEVNIYKTSPLKADSDNDNLSDFEEVKTYLTDPNNPDTDADTYLDGSEVQAGYNPKGPGKLTQ